MATVAQLSTRIKARLARRTGTVLDSLILDELTHSQQEILEQSPVLPNFLKATATFTVSGAHSAISLLGQAELVRFLKPLTRDDAASLEYYDTASTRYVKIPRFDSWEQLEEIYPLTGTVPKGYYWDGNVAGSLLLQPTPTASVQYRARFYRASSETPAANATTPWTLYAGDYLMHTAGVEIATFLRDKDALAYFAPKRQEAYQRFLSQITSQEMADTDMVMGD